MTSRVIPPLPKGIFETFGLGLNKETTAADLRATSFESLVRHLRSIFGESKRHPKSPARISQRVQQVQIHDHQRSLMIINSPS